MLLFFFYFNTQHSTYVHVACVDYLYSTFNFNYPLPIENDPGRLDDEDTIEILAAASGRRYSYNNNTGESTWLDDNESD